MAKKLPKNKRTPQKKIAEEPSPLCNELFKFSSTAYS